MRLPYSEYALVPDSKVREYLLSDTHPLGRSKAVFFRSLGFDPARPTTLQRQLIRVAQSNQVRRAIQGPFGTKYVLDGEIESPEGHRTTLRTVWIVKAGERIPRFVTAYPR